MEEIVKVFSQYGLNIEKMTKQEIIDLYDELTYLLK